MLSRALPRAQCRCQRASGAAEPARAMCSWRAADPPLGSRQTSVSAREPLHRPSLHKDSARPACARRLKRTTGENGRAGLWRSLAGCWRDGQVRPTALIWTRCSTCRRRSRSASHSRGWGDRGDAAFPGCPRAPGRAGLRPSRHAHARRLAAIGEGSLKATNTRRDPRVSLSVVAMDNPYRAGLLHHADGGGGQSGGRCAEG